MIVKVKVQLRNQVSLPETAVCRVEIRDVTLLNDTSVMVCSHQSRDMEKSGITLLSEMLEVPDDKNLVGRDLNVWAHLSLIGSKRVQSGDLTSLVLCARRARIVLPRNDWETLKQNTGRP